jgi:hypothetical protein
MNAMKLKRCSSTAAVVLLSLFGASAALAAKPANVEKLDVYPAELKLTHIRDARGLLVTGVTKDGARIDLTADRRSSRSPATPRSSATTDTSNRSRPATHGHGLGRGAEGRRSRHRHRCVVAEGEFRARGDSDHGQGRLQRGHLSRFAQAGRAGSSCRCGATTRCTTTARWSTTCRAAGSTAPSPARA